MKSKDFEKKVYECLGVNFFRKYILFNWEKICKLVKFNPGYRLTCKNITGLKKYKKLSKGFEVVHIGILIYVILLFILNKLHIISLVINGLINGYCVITQRYNIIRVNEIIEKYQKLEDKKKLKRIENIDKIINDVLKIKNNIKTTSQTNNFCDQFNVVIKDDVLSLSVSNKLSANEINDRSFENFDIILNNTNQKIGSISFDYFTPNFELGNVNYAINDQFRNNGYATRALRLLVQLLKNNNFKGNKDLYFLVNYYNECSKQVILNNGGEIVNGGDAEAKSSYTLRIKI